MAISPGTRLGPYEIVAQIGRGGMGEVYRALDTNLGRAVAIKTLPHTVADDPERLARFEREAKTLAALNHPHIAQIYGFEKADGIRAIVMELVEGPTLFDRVTQGRIPLDEALPIASQIGSQITRRASAHRGVLDWSVGRCCCTRWARSMDAEAVSRSGGRTFLDDPARG